MAGEGELCCLSSIIIPIIIVIAIAGFIYLLFTGTAGVIGKGFQQPPQYYYPPYQYQQPYQQQIYPCLACGHPLRYIPYPYQKWYCDTCKKYIME